MKTITIKCDQYNQEVISKIDSDANMEDVTDSLKGLLLAMGYSYETINEYFIK